MYSETIRVRGHEAGSVDVIKCLRNISSPKSFFRDMYKVNGVLNKNNVKISFDPSGAALLNQHVSVAPAELRSNLRTLPAEQVFANVPPTMESTSLPANVQNNGAFVSNNNCLASPSNGMMMSRIFVELKDLSLKAAPSLLARFTYNFYVENRELLEDQLQIHYDERFLEDIWRIVQFLARRVAGGVEVYLANVTANTFNELLYRIFNNRYVAAIMPSGGATTSALFVRCEQILENMGDIRRRIMNTDSFMETILNLLEDLTHTVVDKIVTITKMLLIDMQNSRCKGDRDTGNNVDFESFFDQVLRTLMGIAKDLNLVDFSSFILLLENEDFDEVQQMVSRFFDNIRRRLESSAVVKCTTCRGSYTLLI